MRFSLKSGLFIKRCKMRLLTYLVLLVCVFPASSTIYDGYDHTNIYTQVGNLRELHNPVGFDLLHTGLPGIGVTYVDYNAIVPYTFMLFVSNGDGSFRNLTPQHIDMPDYTFYNLTGDLNGDGYCDLFTGTTISPWKNIIRLSIPSGSLGDPYGFTSPTQTRIWGVCDMEGDSPPDLYGTSEGSVVVWCGTESGQYDVMEVYSGLSAVHASAGDLDLDGDPDMVVVTSTREVHILRNEGNMEFSDIGTYGPITGWGLAVSLCDLNGNGYLDIITGSSLISEGAFHTYINDGSAFFNYGFYFQTDKVFSSFSAQDLDMDGCVDLTVLDNASEEIDIYKGNGAGSFLLVPTLCSMDFIHWMAVFDDYDCDGDPDMVCVYSAYVGVSYLNSYWNNTYTQGCESENQFSDGFSLGASSNPFSNGVTISVSECLYPLLLDILDLSGRVVTRIPSVSEGLYHWDGTTLSGEESPAGIYVISAQVSGAVATTRLVKLD